MRRAALSSALFLLAGCVAEDKYLAKVAEAEQLQRRYQDESQKNGELAVKVAELSGRLGALEEESRQLSDRVRAEELNLSAKQADLRAAQQRLEEQEALVQQLVRSKVLLERARAELERKSGEYDRLAQALRAEIGAGQVEISELRGRMTLRLKDQILFASGSAAVNREGRAALDRIASALRGIRGRTIRVEGYTDDVPVSPAGPFPSNWELSTARAVAVVRYLQERGVDPTLLAAAGYGEFHPVAANDTAEGRSLNRRIEIVLAASVDAMPPPAVERAAPRRRAPAPPPAGR
ncbi:MAG TPA: OmpA family protein [Anaeromyxobacteraceae bacterium]|nr:OmpA family protein [Anaeromyxobacteraceae bacterium]